MKTFIALVAVWIIADSFIKLRFQSIQMTKVVVGCWKEVYWD